MRWLGFFARRMVSGLGTVFAVASLCFFALHALPGDPVDVLLDETASGAERAQLRGALRLDQPLVAQYVGFVTDLVARGMGRSFVHPERTALAEVWRVWPSTAVLAVAAMGVAWAVAIPLAVLAARRPGSRTDAAVGVSSLVAMALPSVWTGPLLVLLFCVILRVLPFPGPDAAGPSGLVLPALTLGASMAGILTRMGRSALREVLREPYIAAARAKGLSEPVVLVAHALRSAMVPLMTVGGAQLSALLGGAVVTEKVFERRGLGSLFLESLLRRDVPVALACVVAVACTVVLVQLMLDVAYAWVDPRIRSAG
ncbi:MAG: ABC transporter permease [Myxococcales bacterium]|nr:ABC transporter permease [Myxococcales bacterium]